MNRFAALVLLVGVAHAQTESPTTISALNPAATLNGTEVLPCDQGGPGLTVKCSVAQLEAYFSSGDISNATSIATNTLAARTQAARQMDRYNVKDFGAKEDATTVTGCTAVVSSVTLTCTGAAFASTDCQSGSGCTGAFNKGISIPGALAGNLTLTTTIVGFTNSTTVTLATPATQAVPISYISGISAVGGTAAGTYAPGDTVTPAGGTGTAGLFTLKSTQVESVISIVSAGTGGTGSPCYVTGTTGAGVLFVQKVSLTGGGGINGIVGSGPQNNGYYTTNPTNPVAEPVAGCNGLTGATLSLQMGPAQVLLTSPGTYSAVLTNPVSQSGNSTSGGNGATYTVNSITTGYATYGTDDTAAWSAAVARVNTDYSTSATRRCIYMPAGVSFISGAVTPFAVGVPGCILGDLGDYKSTIYLAPTNSGSAYDVFSWDDAWEGRNGNFQTYGTTQSLNVSQGPTVIGISFLGDRTTSADPTIFDFYGQDDNITIDQVNAFNIKGQLIKTGNLGASDTKAYTREGTYGRLRCFSCGDAGKATIEFFPSGSATGGSDIDFLDYNAYGYYGDCIWIHSDATNIRAYNIHHIRCEGNQGNSANITADGIHISGANDTGQTERVHVLSAVLNSTYYGGCGVHIDSSSANTTMGTAPYDIEVSASFGGIGFGSGFCVDSGSNDFLRGANTGALMTQPVLTVGAVTFPYIYVDGGGLEASWSTSINSASVANVLTPSKQQLSASYGGIPTIGRMNGTTISGLPTCDMAEQGVFEYVTNGVASPAFLATVSATGSTVAPVFCTGTQWVYY